MVTYTIFEVSEALEVLSSPLRDLGKLRKANERILRWHETYLKLVRHLHKHVKDWNLATVGVWDMIKKTRRKSIFSLARSYFYNLHKADQAFVKQFSAVYAGQPTENFHGHRISVKLSQKIRAEKHRFRQKCANIANHMQNI